MFGIGRKTSDARRDVRDRYEPELFDNRKLNGNFSGNRDSGADVDLLADACRDLIENRNKARQMGEMASQILPYTMSWDRVAEDLLLIHARG